MKQLINSTRKKNKDMERTAVLRLEMDYELATLFEAINEKMKKRRMNARKIWKISDKNCSNLRLCKNCLKKEYMLRENGKTK